QCVRELTLVVAVQFPEYGVRGPQAEGLALPASGLAKHPGRLLDLPQVAQHRTLPDEGQARSAGVIRVRREIVGQPGPDRGCLTEQLLRLPRGARPGAQDAKVVVGVAPPDAEPFRLGRPGDIDRQPVAYSQRGLIAPLGLGRPASAGEVVAKVVMS